ncbi:MAG: phage tail tape measure protein [Anaerobutyricum hallii]|uniref:phage tail tape measure protein n=1 Tax=Anaerobutyricum hallii TaxID=39488 RepID=UPI002A81394E|nr:phage tail tape measure protein [Anaerobutyricum hallii]MDY4579807.1 phage tail tape measure protein [Anaerobutyricum hallii]
MAGKTVAAVVKLIDDFSNPSREVAAQARDLEKRFNNVADVFNHAGEAFSAAGETLTKSVTAPLTAVGTAAVKFSSDSQDAFQQFAAATGTATEEMGKYKDMINNVYKNNFGESINDVAEAMATVNQNMSYLDDSALQRCTEYAYTLSDTFGYDVAESTRAADTLIKNYGVSAREAFNLITQGAQSGMDYSGEMIDSINEYSVQFKKLGLDAEDMFSIFANGAQNGAFNLDKVGDAVKEFSIRAIDGSDTTKQGFEALGMDAAKMAERLGAGGDSAKEAFNEVIKGLAEMDDPVAQSAAGVNLFGTMWEDLGPQVITSMSTASDAIDKSKESVEKLVNVKYDTLSGALGGLWRTIQVDVLQPIGNQLIPYVTKGISFIQKFTDKWNKLEPATQKTIVKFGMVAAATGPVLLGFGKVSTGIGTLVSDTGKIGSVLKKLTGESGFSGLAKVMTGPFGIAAAAVVTATVLVYQNWDKIGPIIQKIGQRFADFWKTVQPQLEPFINLVKEVASYLEETLEPAFKIVWKAAGDYVVKFFDDVSIVIDGALGVFEGIITFLTGVFQGDWEKAWNGIVQAVGSIFGTLESLVKTPINAVINLVNKAIGAINKISVDLPSAVGGGHIGFNIPTIPTLAKGTDYWQGGIVQISEKGGEIVDLPSGSRVYPHDESVRMARQESKKNFSVTIAKLADSIVVREDSDIDKIAEAIVRKIETAAGNMPQMA